MRFHDRQTLKGVSGSSSIESTSPTVAPEPRCPGPSPPPPPFALPSTGRRVTPPFPRGPSQGIGLCGICKDHRPGGRPPRFCWIIPDQDVVSYSPHPLATNVSCCNLRIVFRLFCSRVISPPGANPLLRAALSPAGRRPPAPRMTSPACHWFSVPAPPVPVRPPPPPPRRGAAPKPPGWWGAGRGFTINHGKGFGGGESRLPRCPPITPPWSPSGRVTDELYSDLF